MVKCQVAASRLILALGAFALSTPASAHDHPGTPVLERADVVGPDSIRLSWTNTATDGLPSFHQGNQQPNTLSFEVEGLTDPSLPGRRYDLDQNARASVIIAKLKPGAHCYKIWSRLGDYRSEVGTAWACATIPEPREPRAAPPAPAPAPPVVRRAPAPAPPVKR